MQVSETIGQEAIFLGVAVLVGVMLFLLYDVLRIFRRIVPHGNLWIGAEDVIYWLVCTGTLFVMLYRENDGKGRGFAVWWCAAWHAAVLFAAQQIRGKDQRGDLEDSAGSTGTVFGIFFQPVIKIVKKITRFFGKQLKKFWKAVKMSLCKL